MRARYVIVGNVVEGKKRGRFLGYPTANVYTDLAIPEGIYASRIIIDGKKYHAATFVGSAKTFGEDDFKVESYILDFDELIYGKEVGIYLYKKLRDNKQFDSQEALVKQMKKDVEATREYFS